MLKDVRKTKIVATLGPASSSAKMLQKLLLAGVDIFRLNFSHGDNNEKKELIARIRDVSGRMGRDVGILADLQGPKIRTGKMKNNTMPLIKGEEVTITTADILGEKGMIPTIYKELPRDVRSGSRILLDDGLLELKVLTVKGEEVLCQVVTGGELKNNKGINLPGVKVSAPSLTEKDRQDLFFCLGESIDFIALSFVRTAEDVEELKRLISASGRQIPIVAKIEKPEALRNFTKILKVADAIMVARGDLGVEVQAEKVPVYQKKIIEACNQAGKPVITATQMLDSMIKNPRPTRAETSDVANAIIDGTDAVMLSGETASGDYPLEAVETMAKVAVDIEQSGFMRRPVHGPELTRGVSQAVAESACSAAAGLNAKAIVVFTQSGRTAGLISYFRPTIPIIAFTNCAEIRRRLSLFWGVRCTEIGIMENTDQQIFEVEKILLSSGFRKGDLIVITMGTPIETRGSTNLMKVHSLGTHGFYEIF